MIADFFVAGYGEVGSDRREGASDVRSERTTGGSDVASEASHTPSDSIFACAVRRTQKNGARGSPTRGRRGHMVQLVFS